MVFYTQYVRPSIEECPFETHEDEGKVERIGYMETEKLVNSFVLAGERLKMFRGAQYAPGEEVPFDAPVSRFDSEMDAILAFREVNKRLEAAAAKAAEPVEEPVVEPVEEPAK